MTTISRGDLGSLEPLGQGGQAQVYSVPEVSLPDAPKSLAYKEYSPKSRPGSPQSLAMIVAVRDRLQPDTRAWLDEHAAWPLRVVMDGSQVTGVLMPLIPESFFQTIQIRFRNETTHIAREIQHLFIEPSQNMRKGMPNPSLAQRFRICQQFAFALAVLHRNDVVFGDISYRNALFTVSPQTAIMLVDCDAVRVKGTAAVVKQLHTAGWEPPEGLAFQSIATDVYKLGLFILRCLSPGDGASVIRDPGAVASRLDRDGRDLLTRTLSAKPGDRPEARDWYYYFRGRLPSHPQKLVESETSGGSSRGSTPAWVRNSQGKWTRVP